MRVPFLDLKGQYESIKDEIHAALGGVLEKTAFAGGPFVSQFEGGVASGIISSPLMGNLPQE